MTSNELTSPRTRMQMNIISKIPRTLPEIQALETEFSEEELQAIVKESSVKTKQEDAVAKIIKDGVQKPSSVWRWEQQVWKDGVSRGLGAVAKATVWRVSCCELMATKSEHRRMENSPPSNQEDAESLACIWIKPCRITPNRVGVPDGLAAKLEALMQRDHHTPSLTGHEHEAMASACMQAVLGDLNVYWIERQLDEVQSREQSIDTRTESWGGFIVLKGVWRQPTVKGATLIQAAKSVRCMGSDTDQVGAVWAEVREEGICLYYQFGVFDWEGKQVEATDVNKLMFVGGKYLNIERWEYFCGGLKSMGNILLLRQGEKEPA